MRKIDRKGRMKMDDIIFFIIALVAAIPLVGFAVFTVIKDIKSAKKPSVSGYDEQITTDCFSPRDALEWFKRNTSRGASYTVISLSSKYPTGVRGQENSLLLSVIGNNGEPVRICLVSYVTLTDSMTALLDESNGVFYADIKEEETK
jgi:hypothetical protein